MMPKKTPTTMKKATALVPHMLDCIARPAAPVLAAATTFAEDVGDAEDELALVVTVVIPDGAGSTALIDTTVIDDIGSVVTGTEDVAGIELEVGVVKTELVVGIELVEVVDMVVVGMGSDEVVVGRIAAFI